MKEIFKDCPREFDLPNYITIMAHDGQGNLRPVRFYNEKAIDILRWGIERNLNQLEQFTDKMGGDTE
jgi:hypothetical protein